LLSLDTELALAYTLFGRKYHYFVRLFLLQCFHFRHDLSPVEGSDNTPTDITRARLLLSVLTLEANF